MDYLDVDKRLEHDYDSSKKGGNRFATILLYMTDLEEKDGGETVFIDAWPTGQREEDHKPIETVRRVLYHKVSIVAIMVTSLSLTYSSLFLYSLKQQALRELRESDQHGILEEGSWQEKMVRNFAHYASQLAVT
jgi:hypothetical protein